MQANLFLPTSRHFENRREDPEDEVGEKTRAQSRTQSPRVLSIHAATFKKSLIEGLLGIHTFFPL